MKSNKGSEPAFWNWQTHDKEQRSQLGFVNNNSSNAREFDLAEELKRVDRELANGHGQTHNYGLKTPISKYHTVPQDRF